MSVRAYRLINIKTEKSPTFNVWHDVEISRIAQGDGEILTIEKSDAEELLKDIKGQLLALGTVEGEDNEAENNVEHLNYTKNQLTKIIADCGDEDYIEYYCY